MAQTKLAASLIEGITLVPSVASNALTIAVKTQDGSDPSADNPIFVPFRSATASSGSYSFLALIAALSLTIPDTATLGTANSTPFRYWIVIFNDGGTARLGVVNCLHATTLNIYPLRDDILASSTTISTGSDSAHVIYSGTGVTSKPMKIIGYIDYDAGLATAGTYASAPTKT